MCLGSAKSGSPMLQRITRRPVSSTSRMRGPILNAFSVPRASTRRANAGAETASLSAIVSPPSRGDSYGCGKDGRCDYAQEGVTSVAPSVSAERVLDAEIDEQRPLAGTAADTQRNRDSGNDLHAGRKVVGPTQAGTHDEITFPIRSRPRGFGHQMNAPIQRVDEALAEEEVGRRAVVIPRRAGVRMLDPSCRQDMADGKREL